MNIYYKGHKGTLDIATNEVYFYDKKFKNILEAIDYILRLEIEIKIFETLLEA